MPEHAQNPTSFAQAERLPSDPLAVTAGRYTAAWLQNGKSKASDPLIHIVLPDDGEKPGSGDW